MPVDGFVKKYMQESFDGGFNLIYVNDANGKPLNYVINQTMMRIDLPTPLKPKEKVSFSIKWWYNINNYRVDGGRERVRTDFNGVGAAGFGPWGRWGGWGGGGWGFGFNDPFFGGPDVRSYTIYTSGIDLKIDRAADGQRLFEGKAEAVSRSNRLPRLVPNLVDAMFTGFPGNSGETLRITIRDDEKTVRPTD